MRQENLDHERAHTYTTPRTLMSILRLCQALAKLQFRNEVNQDDVEEALRLMRMSKISLVGLSNVLPTPLHRPLPFRRRFSRTGTYGSSLGYLPQDECLLEIEYRGQRAWHYVRQDTGTLFRSRRGIQGNERLVDIKHPYQDLSRARTRRSRSASKSTARSVLSPSNTATTANQSCSSSVNEALLNEHSCEKPTP